MTPCVVYGSGRADMGVGGHVHPTVPPAAEPAAPARPREPAALQGDAAAGPGAAPTGLRGPSCEMRFRMVESARLDSWDGVFDLAADGAKRSRPDNSTGRAGVTTGWAGAHAIPARVEGETAR